MKIKVISEFYDKFHTSTLYKVGTVLDFEDNRAQDVIARRLAVAYSEPKPEPKKEAKPEPKPEPAPKPEVKEKEETEAKPKDVKPKK